MRKCQIHFETNFSRKNLTVVLERTLFDGSNESDKRGDVILSVGVVGCDNKKSKC